MLKLRNILALAILVVCASDIAALPFSALQRAAYDAIPEGGWFAGIQGNLTHNYGADQRNGSAHSSHMGGTPTYPSGEEMAGAEKGPLIWGSLPAGLEELAKVSSLRASLRNVSADGVSMSHWIHVCADSELLRFLRKADGKVEDALRLLVAHGAWRVTKYGADTIMQDPSYATSNIHKEVFWLGTTFDGCPALVVRTQAHDGADYDEDPRKFTAVLVHILETGRARYGVGVTHQVCLLLDRGPVEGRRERRNERDMSVIPNLVKLFGHVYGTVMSHYPELLRVAKILPSSWFFSMCFKLTSVVMDPASKTKFCMVRPETMMAELAAMFPRELLPPHLGGTALLYGSVVVG